MKRKNKRSTRKDRDNPNRHRKVDLEMKIDIRRGDDEPVKNPELRQTDDDELNGSREKRFYRKDEIDEQDSDGSANAFEGK